MRTTNEFGEGSSPALHGDALVVQWDHEGDDFIVALDKRSGKELWRQARDEPTSWATPVIVEVGGHAQVIASATNAIRAYDLRDGKELWSCTGMTRNVVPTPIVADGVAYIMSGFRGAASRAIRLADAQGALNDSKAVLWSYDHDTPYVPSPVLYGDRLYFLQNNKGTLTCLNAKTGEKVYGPQRLEDVRMVYASLVGAGGNIYVVSREGTTVVFADGPEFEVKAINQLDDEFNASPAIVGNELYLRGAKHLYCIAKE
jgi:outer membrane protein assembly factor BamB